MTFGCKECAPHEIGRNIFNPRHLEMDKEKPKLKKLADSILEFGLIEAPILTKVDWTDKLIAIAGNRRIWAMVNILQIEAIPYIPLEWRGVKEPISADLCYRLTCEVHDVQVPHDPTSTIEKAMEAAKNGIAPESMTQKTRRLLSVVDFLNNHQDLRELVLNVKGSSKSIPRTRVGSDIVRNALTMCGYNEDRVCHHLNLYISGVYKGQREMREGIRLANVVIEDKMKKAVHKKMERGELK